MSDRALEALNAGKAVASIAGCQHGCALNIGGQPADAEQIGGTAWQLQRAQLLALLMEATGEQFPEIRNPLHTRLLARLTPWRTGSAPSRPSTTRQFHCRSTSSQPPSMPPPDSRRRASGRSFRSGRFSTSTHTSSVA
ncbi:MAG: hypothetical protein HGB15_05440 [Chlorobaculum sp.]|nr:hypothetical protein [Chlorobaculum sp.]